MSTTDHEWLIAWLDKSSVLLASDGVRAAVDVVREVWKRRDDTHKKRPGFQSNDRTNEHRQERPAIQTTWVDILRERKTWLMLY